jgi:hypothetical protein
MRTKQSTLYQSTLQYDKANFLAGMVNENKQRTLQQSTYQYDKASFLASIKPV